MSYSERAHQDNFKTENFLIVLFWRGGEGGKRIWERETMLSQLEKWSVHILVSGVSKRERNQLR